MEKKLYKRPQLIIINVEMSPLASLSNEATHNGTPEDQGGSGPGFTGDGDGDDMAKPHHGWSGTWEE